MVEQAIEGCPSCGEAVAGPGGPRTRSRRIRLVLALDRMIYRVAKRWLFCVNSVFFAYAVGIFLAPALAAAGNPRTATPIYGFYGLFCHQRADRSFFVLGRKMACCQRCFAIYGSIFLMGLLFAVVRRRLPAPRAVDVVVLSLPIALDAFAQMAGFWTSTAATRTLTGAMFGTAVCWALLPYFERGFVEMRGVLRDKI